MFLSNCFEIIIITFSSSLFSLHSLPFIPPHCCSNRWPFSTNSYCTLICIYTYIRKHNLLSLYIVNLMHIFKIDHLALDNQLMCSYLGKTTIRSFHFKWHHFSDVSCFSDQILIRWNLQRVVRGFITLTVWREMVSHGRDGITADKSVWKFHRSRNVFLGLSPYIQT